ncbi:Aromatic amino acid aminotransferase [Bifidobacterium actinocoloniiforme DSM 22766]|uniref:Aminotransferase n=1 Tax=Bifidobacterium actinocoloniiforme DSM 22766 TaxID=1437605 RepID=A0A086Z062_9BIFI|nr:aminotransferase class I/II-fold pyridoxal phosphate-dependent enzyme [Bifidobacterium actinocoloniiforme]AKV55173.1 aromatic amino acid aminotransferase [Bifidobacterium actinocoloniiforme DSM 22766]KFI39912.1 Aromatic amino acid aminotransferase [Bifidobacterium actinocoloniiforme DSM 22766]
MSTVEMNERVRAQKPSDILGFNAEISAIDGIVKLTLGEPDFPTPEHVKEAAIRSIQANESHYTPSRGLPQLRQAAADFLEAKYGTRYDPDTQILVTAGATGGIYSTLTAILNPGDTVFIPTPIFPLYIPITQLAGGSVVFIDTSDDGFILTPAKLEAAIQEHPDTAKALVLNFPTNPTGVTYNREQLQGLAQVARAHGLLVLSDEIYSELTYEGTHVSMGQVMPERTIVLNGVSKSHAMTGWRIGLAAGPADLIEQIGKVSEFSITCATANAQYAALEALGHGQDDAEPMRQAYRERRDFLVPALRQAGLESTDPQGAFYLFVKLPERMKDSWKFAYSLAREAGVAVIPGASFGPGGDGYVRISYAASMEDLRTATERIAAYMRAH